MFHYSFLTKIDGFNFKFTPRDPSCLPKEYPVPEGEVATDFCPYFLDDYRHYGMADGFPTERHIDKAMKQINSELQN